MTFHDTEVIVTETIDQITVDLSRQLFVDLQARGHSVDVAARVTAEYIEQQIAHYPPRGRCSVCGELWAWDDHDLCHREGDAPVDQWQATTPEAVYAR